MKKGVKMKILKGKILLLDSTIFRITQKENGKYEYVVIPPESFLVEHNADIIELANNYYVELKKIYSKLDLLLLYICSKNVDENGNLKFKDGRLIKTTKNLEVTSYYVDKDSITKVPIKEQIKKGLKI